MAESSRPSADSPPLPPWKVMGGALGALILALGLRLALGESLVLARVILIVLGMCLAGAALWLQPRCPRLILAGAALACLASWSMEPTWDSAILVTTVLMWVAVLAAFIVAAPWWMGWIYVVKNHVSSRPTHPDEAFAQGQQAGQVAAKVLVSLLILLHFGGIATAILSTAAGGVEPAWLAQRAWMHYRGYLMFAHLTNAYKFYSPQPGPAYLIFARIQYDDGSVREIELPNRAEHAPDPLAQEYTRRLSVARSITEIEATPPSPRILERRQGAYLVHGVPMHPYLPANLQYEVPNESARRLMKEYARHLARTYPHPSDPSIGITGIRVYRITHMMLDPSQMANSNNSPTAKWTFLPYYQGEFTAEGVLKDPYDPLLYWLIPIFRAPRGQSIDLLRAQEAEQEPDFGSDFVVHNFFETHKNQRMAKEGQGK